MKRSELSLPGVTCGRRNSAKRGTVVERVALAHPITTPAMPPFVSGPEDAADTAAGGGRVADGFAVSRTRTRARTSLREQPRCPLSFVSASQPV